MFIVIFSLFVLCLCLYAFNVKILPPKFKKRFSRDNIRNISQVAIQRINTFQRYKFITKFVSVVPIFMWLIVFQLPKWIPNTMKPSINTTTLPLWENYLTFGVKLQHWPASYLEQNFPSLDSLLDVWAGILYFVHFFMAGLFALLLYIYVKTNVKHASFQPWTFFFCFGIMNLLAVINQLSWPTAPPWWVDGNTGPASYEMKGDPAVLADVDQLLGYPFFANIWSSSPIVFGSFPSLHGAWPFMISLFAPTTSTKILAFWYTASVWWAAVFLNHHYIIDLLGGLFYCLIGFFVGRYLMHNYILPKIEMESKILFSKKMDHDIENMNEIIENI